MVSLRILTIRVLTVAWTTTMVVCHPALRLSTHWERKWSLTTTSTHASCRASMTIPPVRPTGKAIATDNGCRLGTQAAGIVGTTMIPGIGTTRTTTATIAAGTDGTTPGIMATIVLGTTDITATMVRAGMVAMYVHLLIVAV